MSLCYDCIPIAGSGDYQPLDEVIAFDVRDTEQTVTTTITDNDILESVESFSATIVALEGLFPVAVGMNATVTVDIVDNDSEWGVGASMQKKYCIV